MRALADPVAIEMRPMRVGPHATILLGQWIISQGNSQQKTLSLPTQIPISPMIMSGMYLYMITESRRERWSRCLPMVHNAKGWLEMYET